MVAAALAQGRDGNSPASADSLFSSDPPLATSAADMQRPPTDVDAHGSTQTPPRLRGPRTRGRASRGIRTATETLPSRRLCSHRTLASGTASSSLGPMEISLP